MIGKASIRPTAHYLMFHSDMEWDLVVKTVLSPTKTRLNKRHGKNRFNYVKVFRKFAIEVHAEIDPVERITWIINAFRMKR